MIVIKSDHIEIDHARDIELEGFVDHVECNAALNLTRIFKESFLVDVSCEEAILE